MIVKNFIVFEGLDGTGTTSQLTLLKKAFCACKNESFIYFTFEPTDSPIGKLCRAALSGAVRFDAKTIAYLFGADRCEHIYGEKGILEQLHDGKAVFCDRYLFSSLAYQGLTAGEDQAKRINADFPLPEYLFFFDLSAQTAMERITKRNTPIEIYEKEPFQQQVAQAYQKLLAHYSKNVPQMHIIHIDAAASMQKIHEKIWSVVKDMPIK